MTDKLIADLRELIDHGSIEEARNGIREAGKLSAELSLPFLFSLFTDRQYTLCQTVSEVLAGIGKPAFNYLRNLYSSADENQKYWSIRTLINGSEKEIEFLTGLAAAESNEICAFIAGQVGSIKKPELVLPLLTELLKKDDWHIRKKCAESLTRFGKIALPELKKLFSLKNRDLKYWVIRIMADISGNELFPLLKKMLQESPDQYGYYAVSGLGRIKSPESFQLLVDTLFSKKWMLREESAEILKNSGEKAIPFLQKALGRNGSGQMFVLSLIAQIMQNRAIPLFREIFEKQGTELRYYAVNALKQMNTAESVSMLIDTLADRAWIVRKQAATVLAGLGTVALPAIQLGVSDLRDNVSFWSVRILSEMSSWNPEIFYPLLKSTDNKRRAWAAFSARNVRNSQTVEMLFPLLSDRSWSVRKEAADSIAAFGETCFSSLFCCLVKETQQQHYDYWGEYIFSQMEPETVRKFLSGYIAPSSSDKEISRALRIMSSLPSENAWNDIVQRFLSGDAGFRKRLKEMILKNRMICLIRPFIRALKRVRSEIASDIGDVITGIPGHEKFKIIREEYFRSGEEQSVLMIRFLCGEEHPAKYQFLSELLMKETRNRVKKEAYRYLGSVSDHGMFQMVFNLFLNASEEDKSLIVSVYCGDPGPETIRKIICAIPEQDKQQAFWTVKFVKRFVLTNQDLFTQLRRTASPHIREWVEFILKQA